MTSDATPNPTGTSGEARRAIRRAQAVDLRIAGASYRQIADQLGVSVRIAWLDVGRELSTLAKRTQEKTEHLRQLEQGRLDRLFLGVYPRATSGDIPAVLAALRIMERRARLMGLDLAPSPEGDRQTTIFALMQAIEQARPLEIVGCDGDGQPRQLPELEKDGDGDADGD